MKKELQEKLFTKYPKIFIEKDLPMTHTCMCWGIETGDGWYDLLDLLCGRLQSMTDWNAHLPKKFPQTVATQVKEKFGTLRFYTSGSSEYQDGMIDFAEALSGTICDICGKAGKRSDEGWIACRCPDHEQ